MKRFVLFVLLPAFLAGCGSSSPPPEVSKTPALPEGHVDPATVGTITGRVNFRGKAPVMAVIDMSSNPQCERQHRTPALAQTVVVNANGTLRNVFVHISDGLPPARWTPPAAPAQLSQNGCIYEPHVQGMMTGQDLDIINNDPVNHNVHAECEKNSAWNESQPPRAEHKDKQFALEEIMFPVTCSVHPWMRAWLAVSAHPFFAVSSDDGSFTLTGVPPGSYTLEAVHEKYGRKEGHLTVAPKGTATIEFTYGTE